MFLYEIDDEESKREMQEFVKKTRKEEERIKHVVETEYHGDRTAYDKATFSMIDACLLLGKSSDEIRQILFHKLPDNSPRVKIMRDQMDETDFDKRIAYPGGYEAYEQDVRNGFFGKFSKSKIEAYLL
jgi:hypothetical protein